MDHRSSQRFSVHHPIVLSSDHLLGEGTVHNLSIWGCRVESTTRVLQGMRLRLDLLVREEDGPMPIGLARVRWVDGWQFGAEFLTMPKETRMRLRRYLLSLHTHNSCAK